MGSGLAGPVGIGHAFGVAEAPAPGVERVCGAHVARAFEVAAA